MVNGLRRPKGIPALREWIEQTTGFLGLRRNNDEEKISWVAIPITPLQFLPNF